MNLITQSELKALLQYDSETGVFTWLARPRVRAGKVAGNRSPVGYWRIGLGGKPSTLYQAHRLAWLYMVGEWPAQDIDHINGNRLDNRFENLRAVPRSTNLENLRGAKGNSSTRLLGVKCSKGKFQAGIQVRGARYHLGTFDSAEQAHAVYLEAKRRLHIGCTL